MNVCGVIGTFHMYALANREATLKFVDLHEFTKLAKYWMMNGCAVICNVK